MTPHESALQQLLTIDLPDGRRAEVEPGTRVADVIEREGLTAPSPVLAAFLGNRIVRLDQPIERSERLRLVEHASIDGLAIYERSVICLLLLAVREAFPTLRLYVNHSIDNCLFCELHMPLSGRRELVTPDAKDLDRLRSFMRERVDAAMPLETEEMTVEEAVRIFRRQGNEDKVQLLSYRKGGRIHLYRMGDFHAHFYGYLAPHTGVLQHWELIPYHTGFLLQLPKMGDVTALARHRDFPKLYKQYTNYERWVNKLGIPHVAALNKTVQSGGVQDVILTMEALHEKRFSRAADKILHREQLPRVLCIAGPSSSGKTTTGKRLRIQLRVNGIECVPLGMDNYFVDRDETPRDEKGDFDFESFDAIDHARFNDDVARLIAGKKVTLPKFDFKLGSSRPGEELRLKQNQVLLIEGIHGLNPRLLSSIPNALKYKIYVSPVTALNLDNTNRIRSSDVRVLRRMVRDHKFRGYSAEDTLRRWASVRAGEEAHIFPYQHLVNFIINTSLLYEMSVLKPFAEPLLAQITDESPMYSESRRLLSLLGYFLPIPDEFVPTTSILREFIGKSVFSY